MGLREMRLQLRWSQQRLADELGVSLKTVYNWERHGPPKPVLLYLKTKSPLREKAAI
jgi:DNA-binding XRE family transcriptional regulator